MSLVFGNAISGMRHSLGINSDRRPFLISIVFHLLLIRSLTCFHSNFTRLIVMLMTQFLRMNIANVTHTGIIPPGMVNDRLHTVLTTCIPLKTIRLSYLLSSMVSNACTIARDFRCFIIQYEGSCSRHCSIGITTCDNHFESNRLN